MNLTLLLAVSVPAISQTFIELYYEALDAHRAGDIATAIPRLEQAVALQPENVDALLLLGTLYGFEQRFAEALETLERGLVLAPEYTDLRIAIARINSWQGKSDEAISLVEQILADQPNNVGALNLRARVAYYVGDMERAERMFSSVLEQQPENLEALLGLADVNAAQGKYDLAESQYRRAQTIDPMSAEVAERLSRERPRTLLWQLDTSGSYSWFSRDSRPSWRESFNQISYRVSPNTVVHGRVELSERFDRTDTYLQAGMDHRISDRSSGYVYLGLTPSADFRERRALLGGGAIRLRPGQEEPIVTVVTIDAKQAAYSSGDVTTIKPGLQLYFLAGRLWLSGQWINTWDETDRHVSGWSVRVDGQASERVRLYAGLADAPETEANRTVDTRSIFGGAIMGFTPQLSTRFDYAHEDRENAYIRESVNVGVSLRF